MKMRGLRNENLDMYPFASDDSVVVYSLAARKEIWSIKLRGSARADSDHARLQEPVGTLSDR